MFSKYGATCLATGTAIVALLLAYVFGGLTTAAIADFLTTTLIGSLGLLGLLLIITGVLFFFL